VVSVSKKSTTENVYHEILSNIPQFSHLGLLFRSSKPIELTETETEYVVNCCKHIFSHHIIFQFNVTNTLNDQLLEHVTVKMESETYEFSVENIIPIATLPVNTPGIAFVCMKKSEGSYPIATFSNLLKFIVKDVDTTTGEPDEHGNEDEYQLEDLEIGICDYIQKLTINNFQQVWDELGEDYQHTENLSVPLAQGKSIQDTVNDVCEFFGMQPIDHSEKVTPKKKKHVLFLAGKFVGGIKVLVRARMKQDSDNVMIEMTARSTNLDISAAIATALCKNKKKKKKRRKKEKKRKRKKWKERKEIEQKKKREKNRNGRNKKNRE